MRLAAGACSILAAGALAACGVIPAPPGPLQTNFVPEITATAQASQATSDGFSTEQHLAVRIRVQTCTGWGTGSGWILSDHEVVTNRHVIAGATSIEVTTYDGRELTALSSKVATVADLGVVTLDSVFTETAQYQVASLDAQAPITIVGYPEGQSLTVEDGNYLKTEKDSVGTSDQLVWLLHAHVKPGNSGSAVYNDQGKVVAVVYAGDDDQTTLAWPVAWLDELMKNPAGWQDNTNTC
jgi:S1-C subfamily serine protease